VRSGSTYTNSGGTLHSATSVITHENVNYQSWDYDIALVQVCISFNVSMYNEILVCISSCCDNQLYLKPSSLKCSSWNLISEWHFMSHILSTESNFKIYNFFEYHLSILSFQTQYLHRYKRGGQCGTIFWTFLHEY